MHVVETLTCTSSAVSTPAGTQVTTTTPTFCGFVGNPNIIYSNQGSSFIGFAQNGQTSSTINISGFNTGANTVTATATDNSGNSATCTFLGEFKNT